MSNNNHSLSKILAFICLAFFLQSCSNPLVPEEISPATAQASIVSQINCEGSIEYAACYTVISQGLSALQTFDIVIQVDTPRYIGLPLDCPCQTTKFCATLEFPPLAVAEAAVVGIEEPYQDYTTLESDGMGSYIGFENPLGPRGQGNSTPPQNYEHEICVNAGDQIMFRFHPSFFANYDLSRAVIRAGGICIVGDVHNPRIFDDKKYVECSE